MFIFAPYMTVGEEEISVDDTSSQDDDQLDSKSGSLASQHSNYASSQASLTSLSANQPEDFMLPHFPRDRSVSIIN